MGSKNTVCFCLQKMWGKKSMNKKLNIILGPIFLIGIGMLIAFIGNSFEYCTVTKATDYPTIAEQKQACETGFQNIIQVLSIFLIAVGVLRMVMRIKSQKEKKYEQQ